ncbi:zinc/manganese transport system substrate-binding protein [Haloferula luteola]|uniref:Zinc/manganese transport system substrate-binding protein n=1 Tax=Haloferula luteola TaxID=595692 RepID=A0A840UXM9_9BACT|nr:metal ABC transporter substrate-binding protein [Haloferula luteola]MBB5350532.1 zinc/manganese transport system substrate-binding protein [Haloferula luteola]
MLSVLGASANLKIAVLHPLLGDLAQQVGGDRVTVTDLLGPNGDPHHFEPTPAQLRQAGSLDLVLACGVGLEADLPTLRSLLPPATPLFEVGSTLPTIEGSCADPSHDHSTHQHGKDPHWWHSVEQVRRAVTSLETEFTRLDPDGQKTYHDRALAYRQTLDALDRWVRREVARIPRDRRILATSHAAFGYFCHEHEFQQVAVQGLTREQMPDAQTLAKTFSQLRSQHVRVIFPEKGNNPATLQALVQDGGLQLGPALDADGTHSASFEAMMRSNVAAIRQTLTTAPH